VAFEENSRILNNMHPFGKKIKTNEQNTKRKRRSSANPLIAEVNGCKDIFVKGIESNKRSPANIEINFSIPYMDKCRNQFFSTQFKIK